MPKPVWPALKSSYPLLLVALVALSYAPVLRAGFVWDDDVNIQDSPNLHDLAGLVRIWTDPRSTQQYYPLTHTSFWLQARTTGLAPLPFHALNVALHALAAVLLLFVLRRLALAGTELAATLFALHPLNVESVAWVTERKNVLSGALVFAACLCYLSYDEAAFAEAGGSEHAATARRRRRAWWLAFGLFVLALAAKTAVAVVPAALFVAVVGLRGRRAERVALALAPFFVVGVGAGLGTAFLERTHLNAAGADFAWSAAERLLIAGHAFFFYLQKLVLPEGLIFFYPKWDIHAPFEWLFPSAVLVLTVLLYAQRKRWGLGPLVAWLAYGVLVFPALGFFNVYFMRFSYVQNHFQYLAGAPVLTLIAAAATRALQGAGAQVRWSLAAAATLACAWLTFSESTSYRNYDTLFRTTLARNPDAWVASYNLALRLQERGRAEEAVPLYLAARRAHPNDAQIVMNLGTALAEAGHLTEALTALREAVRLRPDQPEARLDLATALELAREPAAASAEYREALRLRPGFTRAKRQLAWLLATTSDSATRDGASAVTLARSACAETVRAIARCQDTWAAAEAAAGDFESAATRARQATELARREGQAVAAQRYEARAQLYAAHQPFISESQPAERAAPSP